jgi:hypothetical protein
MAKNQGDTLHETANCPYGISKELKDCDDSSLKRFSLGVELRRDFRRGNRAFLQLGPRRRGVGPARIPLRLVARSRGQRFLCGSCDQTTPHRVEQPNGRQVVMRMVTTSNDFGPQVPFIKRLKQIKPATYAV